MVEPMPDSPLIAANNLGRQIDSESWLIRNVDLQVHAGDRVAVVGSSGSGKTVLLRTLAMLDPLTEGAVTFEGRSVSGSEVPRYRTEVAYLQQRATLVEGTVEDNLRKPFEFAVHSGAQFDRDRILRWLSGLGRHGAFLEKDQQNLSGGELQITALLRTMQLDPKVLLLDEPTSAMDEASTVAVEKLIEQWLAEKHAGAFVWITHSSQQAARMCDRIMTMRDGRLIAGND